MPRFRNRAVRGFAIVLTTVAAAHLSAAEPVVTIERTGGLGRVAALPGLVPMGSGPAGPD